MEHSMEAEGGELCMEYAFPSQNMVGVVIMWNYGTRDLYRIEAATVGDVELWNKEK